MVRPVPHTDQLPLEEILMAEQYIVAKLRKLELDQVHDKNTGAPPAFEQLKRQQGLYRAVTGKLQTWLLKGVEHFRPQWGYDSYVVNQARRIEEDRLEVEAYEQRIGRELAVRELYHGIKDDRTPTNAWIDTQRTFRKVRRQLRKAEAAESESKLHQALVNAGEWMRERQQGLVTATVALLAASIVVFPMKCHYDYKDKHRPVAFKMYEDETLGAIKTGNEGKVQLHPMNRVAISGHNLNAWINMEYNGGPSYRAIAEDWDVFIRTQPGERSLTKTTELEKVHDWAGIEPQQRPWADIFLRAMQQGKEFTAPIHAPVGSISSGRSDIDRSWTYDYDEHGHMEPYQCGDSKNPQTCYRYVCDSRDYTFTLDKHRLLTGIKLVKNGRETFPGLPHAKTNRMLETAKSLGLYVKGSSWEEVSERVDEYNVWTRAVPIVAHNNMLDMIGTLQRSGAPEFLVHNFGELPEKKEFPHQPCSSPRVFPFGWDEHKEIVAKSDAVLGQYGRITNAFGRFDRIVPRLENDIAVFRKANGAYDRDASKAYTDFGNTGIELHNAMFEDNKLSPGAYALMLAGIWLGLVGAVGFATWKGWDAYKDRGWRNRMNDAGLPTYYRGTSFSFERPRNRLYR